MATAGWCYLARIFGDCPFVADIVGLPNVIVCPPAKGCPCLLLLALLAVERGHRRRRVARAHDRTARRDRLDLGELLRGQRLRRERFVELLDRAHAQRRHELRLLAEHPADRELTRRDAPALRERLQAATSRRSLRRSRRVKRGMCARPSPAPIGLADSSPRDSTP